MSVSGSSQINVTFSQPQATTAQQTRPVISLAGSIPSWTQTLPTGVTYTGPRQSATPSLAVITEGLSIRRAEERRTRDIQGSVIHSRLDLKISDYQAERDRLKARVDGLGSNPYARSIKPIMEQVRRLETGLGEIEDSYMKLIQVTAEAEAQTALIQVSNQFSTQQRKALQAMKAQLEGLEDRSNSFAGSRESTPCVSDPTQSDPFKKISVPVFSGQVEEYGPFKQKFMDLTRGSGKTDVILLEHLREGLKSEEARKLVRDCQTTV